MATRIGEEFDVGGVRLKQPFKVRRLNHFGLCVDPIDKCLEFYIDLLGFRMSDPWDIARHSPKADELRRQYDTKLYFTTHGTDHHSFVLVSQSFYKALTQGRQPKLPDDMTVQQLTWQVGSLAEVVDAHDWLVERGSKIDRIGRDMPGSNWHVYAYDPELHRNELMYGIEQIGWQRTSKPLPMHSRGFRERPALPQMSEADEVKEALEKGVDILSGFRQLDRLPAIYDVDGIKLPRPFKIVRHGPVRLLCHDVAAMERFYVDTLGFVKTEETSWEGQRSVFLRCNTEHHTLALYPETIRRLLDWPARTTLLSFGIQVANYRQLKNAVRFLSERGCRFVDMPPELTPGIDFSAHVLDPSGQAIELYFAMDQVGWDGKVRPREKQASLPFERWPETVAAKSDTYMGEPFFGPWG